MRRIAALVLVALCLLAPFSGGRAAAAQDDLAGLSVSFGAADYGADKARCSLPALTVAGTGALRSFQLTLSGAVRGGDSIVLPSLSLLGVSCTEGTGSSDKCRVVRVSDPARTIEPAALERFLRAVVFVKSDASALLSLRLTLSDTAGETARYYSGNTGHYYEYVPASAVPGGLSGWGTALTYAQSRSYLGEPGYLATVTSDAENSFLYTISSGSTGWLGGTRLDPAGGADLDFWYWACGPEQGTKFYNAAVYTGPNPDIPGVYTNWAFEEPNSYGTGESCLTTLEGAGSSWNDLPQSSTAPRGLFIEYGGCAGGFAATAHERIFDFSETVDPPQPSFSISPGSGRAQLVVLRGYTGAQAVCNLETAFAASEPFTVSIDPATPLPDGLRLEGTQIVGAPQQVGAASVRVLVAGAGGGTAVFQLDITVAKRPSPYAPPAAEIAEHGADYILLKAQQDLEYSADGGRSWQTSPRFDCLEPGVEYRFTARFRENATDLVGAWGRVLAFTLPALKLEPTVTVLPLRQDNALDPVGSLGPSGGTQTDESGNGESGLSSGADGADSGEGGAGVLGTLQDALNGAPAFSAANVLLVLCGLLFALGRLREKRRGAALLSAVLAAANLALLLATQLVARIDLVDKWSFLTLGLLLAELMLGGRGRRGDRSDA